MSPGLGVALYPAVSLWLLGLAITDKTPTSLVGDHRSSFIESGMELFPVCEHVPTLCMHVMEVRVEVRGQL